MADELLIEWRREKGLCLRCGQTLPVPPPEDSPESEWWSANPFGLCEPCTAQRRTGVPPNRPKVYRKPRTPYNL